MLVIVGLVVLLAAVAVGVIGVLTNAGAAHLLTDHFAVVGYHVTGSTGSLFLYGIVVGAVAGVGLSVLLTGARRAVNRGRDARHELQTGRQDSAPVAHHPDTQLKDHQHLGAQTSAPAKADKATTGAQTSAPAKADKATTGAERFGLLGRWWRRLTEHQHPTGAGPTSVTAPTKH